MPIHADSQFYSALVLCDEKGKSSQLETRRTTLRLQPFRSSTNYGSLKTCQIRTLKDNYFIKTILLFKDPVRGARSRHGFRGSDWEFCFISLPFIFSASSLTFSVDSTAFSFLFSFYLQVCLYSFISSFDLDFPVGLFRIVIGFTLSNYRLSITS